MSQIDYNDPRVKEVIKHVKIMAKDKSGRLLVADYNKYRKQHPEFELPASTTLYRLFPSWPALLKAAGLDQDNQTMLQRADDESLIASLQRAAKGLNTTVLSSHAYDDYRALINPTLPKHERLFSSSAIRKWLGRWGTAVKRAGLETTERSTPHKPTFAEYLDSLRQAKRETEGMLTEASYAQWWNALPEEERMSRPDVNQIIANFREWPEALRNAQVEQSDHLHEDGMWSAEEARSINANMVVLNRGKPLTEETYNHFKANAKKNLPEWYVLQDLLSS